MIINALVLGLWLSLSGAAANDPPTVPKAAQVDEFTLDCRVLDKKHPFRIPKITVRDGGTASVRDEDETPHIVGHRQVDGKSQPIVRVFAEGSSLDARVTRLDERNVLVELTLSLSSADAMRADSGDTDVQTYTIRRELTQRVALGSTVSAEIKDLKLEIVVDRAN